VLTRRLNIVWPVLLAVYPVLFLWSEGVRHTVLDDVVPLLVLAVLLGAACVAVAAGALRDSAAGTVVAAAVVTAALFLFPAVLQFISGVGSVVPSQSDALLYGRGGGLAYVIIAGIGVAAVFILARSPQLRPHLRAFNSAASVGALVLVSIPVVTLGTYFLSAAPVVKSGGPSGLAATRGPNRDIYYVILDRYGSNGALNAAFGVTGNELPNWLASKGFYLASEARANYDSTRLSLAGTLNLDYFDRLMASVDPSSTNFAPIHELIQDNKVGHYLEEQGFEYIHLGNWYAPTSRVRIADRNLNVGEGNEFQAKLLDQTALPAIEGLVHGVAPAPAGEKLQYDTGRFQFEQLSALADQPGQKFVFAHVLLPHEPYVFAADGSYLAPAQRVGMTDDDRFAAQLAYTNGAVKAFVEHLFAAPEAERPIVVIQADEGPYPPGVQRGSYIGWASATDDQLRTKFGILSAFYLPGDMSASSPAPEPYSTISSVNTFRLIFDRYFGADLPLLPDRSFVARAPKTPYDLIEVTSRLAAP
jgi:hypothetical protein